MATFNYVRLGSRVGVIQRGKTNRRWFSPEDIKPVKDTDNGIMILEAVGNGTYSATINPQTDTVILDGTTIAAGGTLDALETALVGSPVFLKPSNPGGGSVNSVTGNLVGGTSTDPTVSLSGTPMDIVTFDDDGNPEVKPIGITQLTDIASFPSFSNGVFAATAINSVDKTALLSFIEFSTNTPKAGTFSTYGSNGVMKVNDGVDVGDAVNKGQLDARVASLLPINARFVAVGDSLANEMTGVATNQVAYQNQGFLAWTMLLTNGFIYLPPAGNKAIGGQTTTQVINTLGSALALNPDCIVSIDGTNDLVANVTSAVIIANKDRELKAMQSGSKLAISFTIPPRFGASVLTAPQEANRVAVNNWMKTQANSKLIIVDSDLYVTNAWLRDGLHFNVLGAFQFGKIVADIINPYLPNPIARISDALTADNSYNTNPFFTGTTGTKQGGATGTVALNYDLDGQSTGATVVGSIQTVDNKAVQQISVTGNYTGDGKDIRLSFIINSVAGLAATNIIEGIADYKITTNDANVMAVRVQSIVYDAGFATLARTESMSALYQYQNQQTVGTLYTTRSPSIKIGAGTPNTIATQVCIVLKNAGAVSTPINFVLQVSKMGTRKVVVQVD